MNLRRIVLVAGAILLVVAGAPPGVRKVFGGLTVRAARK
jgi:hypothetical protein